jgi:hypothetical protein
VTIKTPEQLEDLAIRDAVNTVVALELRNTKRELVNSLMADLDPQITKARLEGRAIDVKVLVERLMKERRANTSNN